MGVSGFAFQGTNAHVIVSRRTYLALSTLFSCSERTDYLFSDPCS